MGVTLHEQLAVFERLGFSLTPGIGLDAIDRWGAGAFEEEPWRLLYVTLGQTIEEPPWTPLTDRCLHLDTEAVDGPGSYARILGDLARISRGAVTIEAIDDRIAPDRPGAAELGLTVNGVPHRWAVEVQDDWLDTTVLTRLDALLPGPGRFTHLDLHGQDTVLGFETPDGLAALRNATGLPIEWLSHTAA